MALIGTPHVITWFKQHPGMHRTTQGGQLMVCPRSKPEYLAHQLIHRISTTTHCPICHGQLGAPVLIKNEKGEFAWPTAA